MKILKLLFHLFPILFVMCFLTQNLYAQQKATGSVFNSSGEPLAGVTVVNKQTGKSTLTDENGEFYIDASRGSILAITHIGYRDYEIRVSDEDIRVVLLPGENEMEEVVVIGYGTQKKEEVTSAIASVKSENFVKGPVRDAGQLIQGKVAGLSVSTSSGDPSSGTEIQLRGISSLMSSEEPLILIDGIPGTLNSVSPEDIESIDVLKDGSAAAIYGTRGTNGVVLITTRRYLSRETGTLTYNTYVSAQTISRTLDFLTADEYRKAIEDGIGFTDYGTSTDWVKEISRATPLSQKHNLTFIGGNNKTNYSASIDYNNREGLFLKSYNEQVNGRASINHSIVDDKIRFNVNLLSRSGRFWDGGRGFKITAIPLTLLDFYSTIFRNALIRNPTDSVKDYQGNWVERDNNDNPVSYLNETIGESSNKEYRINGSITVTPIRNLNLKLLLSNVQFVEQRGFSETKKHKSTVKEGWNGYAFSSTSDFKDKLLEFTTDYSFPLTNHRLTLLGGYSYQDNKSEEFSMENWDFPTDLYSYYRMESGNALGRGEAKMHSFATSYKLIGFFGRINYSYKEKYLVMASVRREGSSKFGLNHKWGTFPSISVGWRIDNEAFMSNLDFIQSLKIRAGFGVTGIAPENSYLSLTSLNYGDRFLYNTEWIQSLTPVRSPNPDLRWEKKQEYNVGLDFLLFNSKLGGSIDVYKRNTKDMLWNYQVPVPPYLYNIMLANVGTIRNGGVEILLNYTPINNRNFDWGTSLTFSTNSNKLISLNNDLFSTTNDFFDIDGTGPPVQEPTHRVQIGKPIGNFYGYRSIDIDQEGKWIIEGSDGKPKKIIDAKAEDKQILGNGLPKYYLGFNNSLKYKNWNIDILMRGAFGFQILNFPRMMYENVQSVQSNVLRSAFDDVYGKGRSKNAPAYVSYYIENGDYLKIDNITFGYDLPAKKVKYLNNIYLFFSGLNLMTFTGYKGIDPEVNRMGLNPGNDNQYKYPTTRTFAFGLKITLK